MILELTWIIITHSSTLFGLHFEPYPRPIEGLTGLTDGTSEDVPGNRE
jgi:hypothetical protein